MKKVELTGREYLSKYSYFINLLVAFFRVFSFFLLLFTFLLKNNDSKLALLFRYFFAKVFFLRAGDNIYIASLTVIKNFGMLSVGNNLSIHNFCYIDAIGKITIGDNVSIAHNCSLVSFEHTWDDVEAPIKYNPTKLKPIKIGSDVWLGCGVRVLAGSVIEDRVIIAAGAVVKGTLASGYLYGGVPAKRLKKL